MAKTLKRKLKTDGKKMLRRVFEIGQRLKLDILPRHFYSEIPDINVLRSTRQWRAPRSMAGVQSDLNAQAEWVESCTRDYRASLRHWRIHRTAVEINGSDEGYGEVEADFLYSFIRRTKPPRILQIGCGVSTAVCLLAARDEGYEPEVICIEPYPTDYLKRESEAGRIRLIPRKVQDVGLECVTWLGEGDLFFVDSSHTLAPAGEVNLIILELLPRLATGTYVHFHDITFPYDYGSDLLSSGLFFWHETALLYAFLLMNPHFEIAASLAMLHHLRPNHLARCFPDMRQRPFEEGLSVGEGQFPSSIYLLRIS
ncbi:MAG: class I SAM-dependent methyltransferase [Acidobacteriota bacterium]